MACSNFIVGGVVFNLHAAIEIRYLSTSTGKDERMKRKCHCGETHDFQKFKSFKTTFGGRTSHYQHFCESLGKLMILTTTTFPMKLTTSLCHSTALKKYTKLETIVDSDEFTDMYCLSKIGKDENER